jgi:hypothetical protein
MSHPSRPQSEKLVQEIPGNAYDGNRPLKPYSMMKVGESCTRMIFIDSGILDDDQ